MSAPSSSAPSPSAGGGVGTDGSVSQGQYEPTLKGMLFELILTTASYGLLFVGGRWLMREMDPMRKQKKAAAAKRKVLQRRLRDSGAEPIDTNEYEDIISCDMVYPDELNTTFDDIGGLEAEKREIYDLVVMPLRAGSLFEAQSSLLSPPKGILLYGPPGTGKTMMAKAIAKESGAAFINFKLSTAMDKWFGESQKLIRATFTLARKLAPCVLFIDEIDSLLRQRGDTDHWAVSNMKAEFLSMWDGLTSGDGETFSYGVIVVGATNRPWDIDEAILRRMPRTLELNLPGPAQRTSILKIILRSERLCESLSFAAGPGDDDDDASPLAWLSKRHLEGYSGSDLRELCRAAALIPFREYVASKSRSQAGSSAGSEADAPRPIRLDDLILASKVVRPTGEAAMAYGARIALERSGGQFAQPLETARQNAASPAAQLQTAMPTHASSIGLLLLNLLVYQLNTPSRGRSADAQPGSE